MRVMLAKLAVLAMVASISDGVVLTKCDVRDHFEALFKKLPSDSNPTLLFNVEKMIATATCHVELSSGFNTSAFKQLTVPSDFNGDPGHRRKRSAHHEGSKYDLAMIKSSSEEDGGSSMDSSSSEEKDRPKGGRNKPTRRLAPSKDVWTLYGIFQLPDRVMCDSGLVPSLNICQTNCSNFLDDDVDDDIACVEEIIAKVHSLVFQKECLAVKYDDYFAGCP
ncbi:hypothetical protein ACEWY4_017632 [Coilia grayii]|uniref:Lysozyme n=1 Tax=Coilia grayii TaxID=363190 RepID=A0ABD1JHD3_9TELE